MSASVCGINLQNSLQQKAIRKSHPSHVSISSGTSHVAAGLAGIASKSRRKALISDPGDSHKAEL